MTDLLEKLKNIDLEKLNHFYLIFREKSIKQASEKYNISMSTLRHTLLMLEAKLELKLYVQSKKTFIPTEEGKRLFKLCRSLIEVVNTYQKETQGDQGLPIKKDLIVITTTTIANYYLPVILKTYKEFYPDVELKVYSGPEYFNLLNFAFDLIISPKINNVNLVQQKLEKFIFKFYCAPSLKKTLTKFKSPDEMEGQNLLLFSGQHYLSDTIIKKNKATVISNSYPLLINLCTQGMGILSCFNTEVFKHLRFPIDIEEIFSDYISEVEEVYFYYNRLTDKLEMIEKLFSVASTFLKEIEK